MATLAGVLFPLIVAVARLGPESAASLASVATFYFALLAMSTVALYLARTYKNGVGRPVFIVDKNKADL